MAMNCRELMTGIGGRIHRRLRAPGAGLAIALIAPGTALGGLPADDPPIGASAIFLAPSGDPAAPYVGLVGDSTASQLAGPLAARVRPRGVGVVSATVGGCQPTDTVLTYQSAEYFQRHLDCPRKALEKQEYMVRRFRPKIAIWSDVLDWSDIKLKDRVLVAGSPEWKRLMFAGWDRTLDRLGGASVALVLPTWWAGAPRDAPAHFSVDRQRALFRSWAARHSERVTAVDLGPVLCPAGPPCEEVVNGVRLRTDYYHYSETGIRRVIAEIMAKVPALNTISGRYGAGTSPA
jgi:hypothetical protein